MDLSKLPKLSQTPPRPKEPDPNAAGSANPSGPVPVEYQSVGADVWFNSIIGIIAVALGRNFAVYWFDRLIGRTFDTHMTWPDNSPVAYPDLEGHVMITDAGILFFGIMILMEAFLRILWGSGRRVSLGVVRGVWLMAILSAAFNLFVSIRFFADGMIPILSGLAAAFSGYTVADMRRRMAAYSSQV